MLHVLIVFTIYQTIHYFIDKYKPLHTKFRKGILYNNKDNIVSSVTLDSYFDI